MANFQNNDPVLTSKTTHANTVRLNEDGELVITPKLQARLDVIEEAIEVLHDIVSPGRLPLIPFLKAERDKKSFAFPESTIENWKSYPEHLTITLPSKIATDLAFVYYVVESTVFVSDRSTGEHKTFFEFFVPVVSVEAAGMFGIKIKTADGKTFFLAGGPSSESMYVIEASH